MEFLAILIALAAVQLWGGVGALQRDGWFLQFYLQLQALGGSWARVLLAVLLPALAVVVLQYLLSSLLLGIPLLLLYVVVLLYSLGRGDFYTRLTLYRDCWRRDDLQGAFEQAVQLDDFDLDDTVDNASDLHRAVRKAAFYQGFERWFAVVFWFVLLGPAAAIAYRLLFLLARRDDSTDSDRDLARELLHYAEWLPLRLLGFAYALAGNFDRSISVWREHLGDKRSSAELLDLWGSHALAEPVPEGLMEGEEYSQAAIAELDAGQRLQFRSMLFWLAVIAMIQLI
jgi:AmpE protein